MFLKRHSYLVNLTLWAYASFEPQRSSKSASGSVPSSHSQTREFRNLVPGNLEILLRVPSSKSSLVEERARHKLLVPLLMCLFLSFIRRECMKATFEDNLLTSSCRKKLRERPYIKVPAIAQNIFVSLWRCVSELQQQGNLVL